MERGAGQAALPDYHVHTCFSDGEGEVAECIERAVALQLPEIGISDHLAPASLGDRASYAVAHHRLDRYVEAVRDAGARYREITVLLGVEADYLPGVEKELAATLDAYPFDYVIGSVHYVDGFAFDDEHTRRHELWSDVDAVYRGYYRALRLAAAFGRFDVVGHFDYAKVWGYRPVGDMTDHEREALAAVAVSGAAIEINTSGARGPAGEMYPAPGLLARACRMGIPLTFGSDAHCVREIGEGFAEAATLARAAGYRSVLRLSDGRRVRLP
jgi:histidinol-phosphatase (PHP family)